MHASLRTLSSAPVSKCVCDTATRALLRTPSRVHSHPLDRTDASGAIKYVNSMAQEEAPPLENYSSIWEKKYWSKDGGLQPGEFFDASRASPALTHLLSSGRVPLAGRRVFIPGCGRGYDLPEFLRHGAAQAAGLELVPLAQQAAEAYLDTQLAGEERGKAQVFAGDFFKWQHPSVAAWDVGYDYTFMCALHPDMRADWAAGWARHLAPGAQLLCLAFPLNHPRPVGPPWPVTVEAYKELLAPHGFVCEVEEPVPAELSHPPRAGHECMLVFRRQ